MTIHSTHRSGPTWLSPLLILTAAGGMAALGGCSVRDVVAVEAFGSAPSDYRVNHPIAVEEAVDTLDVPVALYTDRLTDPIRANIVAFAQRYRASGSSVIAVVSPSGSPNQNVAAAIAVQIEDTLRNAGVPGDQIDYRVYHAASNERNAPIRVAFSRVVAHTAPCGPWPDQFSVSRENRNYFNFGCATQQNLAAVVDSPLDLLYPRGLTPADAGRRATVLEKYRAGDPFSANLARERAGTGEVADGVGEQ
jgi:pilus assembly protein CpaD